MRRNYKDDHRFWALAIAALFPLFFLVAFLSNGSLWAEPPKTAWEFIEKHLSALATVAAFIAAYLAYNSSQKQVRLLQREVAVTRMQAVSAELEGKRDARGLVRMLYRESKSIKVASPCVAPNADRKTRKMYDDAVSIIIGLYNTYGTKVSIPVPIQIEEKTATSATIKYRVLLLTKKIYDLYGVLPAKQSCFDFYGPDVAEVIDIYELAKILEETLRPVHEWHHERYEVLRAALDEDEAAIFPSRAKALAAPKA